MRKIKRRVLTKPGKGPTVTGLGWYTPEQYPRLREASTDSENIQERWSEWEATASNTLEILSAQGLTVRKIPIDVEEMIAWCKSQGKPLNGASRAEFIARKCREIGIAEAKQQKE